MLVRASVWALIQCYWCSYKKRELGYRDLDKGKRNVNRHREKEAIYKPRRETWNRSFHHGPQKEPTFLTL